MRVLDRVNIRLAPPDLLPERVDLVVIDVSFISLRLVLPALPPLAKPGAPVVALVKPQFEVGRADVGKGGIVRDEAARARALAEVRAAAVALGYEAASPTPSRRSPAARGTSSCLLHLRAPWPRRYCGTGKRVTCPVPAQAWTSVCTLSTWSRRR